MQHVAGILFLEIRDVKKSHDDLKKQMKLDHDEVTQQVDHVSWRVDKATQMLEKHTRYMHMWFAVVVGIMVYMMNNGHATCHVPKQNVTSATDDVYRETAQGNMFTVSFLMNVLSCLLGSFLGSLIA